MTTTLHVRIKFGVMGTLIALLLIGGPSFAETLNPEGVNPHAEAPRKRITDAQRKAAWEAKKKKKAEIEARKAQQAGKRFGIKGLNDGEPLNKP